MTSTFPDDDLGSLCASPGGSCRSVRGMGHRRRSRPRPLVFIGAEKAVLVTCYPLTSTSTLATVQGGVDGSVRLNVAHGFDPPFGRSEPSSVGSRTHPIS